MAPRNPPRQDRTQDPDSGTYIERRNTAQTGQEVRTQTENRISGEDEQDWWLQRLINQFTRDGRVRDSFNQEMNARAASLAQGIETREGPIMMCYNYLSTPHPQLQAMVTENAVPDDVGTAGDLWIDAGNAMIRFQEGVAAAINSSESDWQGSAGNAARNFMAGVGNWVGSAGQGAQLAGTQTNLQASALADAKRNMPEPVDFNLDAANQDLQSTTNPFTYAAKLGTYQIQYNRQQAAHEEAAGVVGMYDSGLAGASTMPAFGAPPQLAGDSGQTKVTKTKIDHTSNQNLYNNTNTTTSTGDERTTGPTDQTTVPPTLQNDPGGRDDQNQPQVPDPGDGSDSGSDESGPGGSDSSGSGGSGSGGSGSGGSGSGGSGGGSGGTTTPSSDLPSLPGGGPGSFPPPGSSNQPGQNPNYAGTPLPIGGLPGPTGGDFDRGRGSGSGGGPGGRGFGPGGSGGYGPGGSQGSPGRGPGLGGVPGGALAAEGAAVRGGPAGARGGTGGGMMPPGRRAEDEDDGEHQRASYLVEGDPDAVFGTDEATAPPVIGG